MFINDDNREAVEACLERRAHEIGLWLLPLVIGTITLALLGSEWFGVPVSVDIVVVNLLVLPVAVGMFAALRRNRIPRRWVAPTVSVAWLLAPICTLFSVRNTGITDLTMLMLLEIASSAVMLNTRWMVAVTLPVVTVAAALLVEADAPVMFVSAVFGAWLVAFLGHRGLLGMIVEAEVRRLELAHALEAATIAERDRDALREQFVHAQRMEAVGTLTAGLAHDMNNILGGILTFTELLHEQATDPRVAADLQRIKAECERGGALTRSLLAFSRRGQYRRKTISIDEVLDDVDQLLSRTLPKSVTFTLNRGASLTIDGDAAQLSQVILNLCLNGADAMNGEGSLTVTTCAVELAADEVPELPAGRYAQITVTDTGAGMDEATRRRMFEPFFTTKQVGKGTGLGLAMVYGAIKAHGGDVTVSSTLGHGTTVTFYLLLCSGAPAEATPADSQRLRLHGRVLIVDDEPMIRAGAARVVERMGLATWVASDGEEALAIFRAHADEIALVLLDMAMPRMGGEQCFHELRRLRPVPVLLVSGYTEEGAAQDLLAAGANGFLEKPYTSAQLANEVSRLLGHTPAAGLRMPSNRLSRPPSPSS